MGKFWKMQTNVWFQKVAQRMPRGGGRAHEEVRGDFKEAQRILGKYQIY